MAEQIIAAVDSFAGQRLVVVRECSAGRGLTIIRPEREDRRSRTWTATTRGILIPNCAVFLVHDAIGRACSLAMRDKT